MSYFTVEPTLKSQNPGSMYGFVLINKDGSFFAIDKKNSCHTILSFVNKLDALIFSLVQQEIDNTTYGIASLNSNQPYLNLLKLGYEKGHVKFALALGFSTISTSTGFKWATHVDSPPVPSLQLINCSLAEIENGIDLAPYLKFMNNKEEQNLAIVHLIQTNHTPTPELFNSAKKWVSDMKINLVKAEADNHTLHHRLIFTGQ